jgi:hypothetical protein
MATQKAPWNIETRKKILQNTESYIEAKESLVHGLNNDYLKKVDWVSTIIDGCT